MYAPALIAAKAPERNELAALMASFTGRVQVLSHTERAPHRPTSYGKQSTKPSAYRDAAKKEAAIVALMRANLIITNGSGSSPRTPRQMRGLLRTHGICMTSPDVERLAARYQIKLLPRQPQIEAARHPADRRAPYSASGPEHTTRERDC